MILDEKPEKPRESEMIQIRFGDKQLFTTESNLLNLKKRLLLSALYIDTGLEKNYSVSTGSVLAMNHSL